MQNTWLLLAGLFLQILKAEHKILDADGSEKGPPDYEKIVIAILWGTRTYVQNGWKYLRLLLHLISLCQSEGIRLNDLQDLHNNVRKRSFYDVLKGNDE